MIRTKVISVMLCMLVIGTPFVIVVTAGTPQDGSDTLREARVFIMGIGKIKIDHTDKLTWVACIPLCIMVFGCGLGKRFLLPDDYISLVQGHFRGLIFPVDGWISPVIGMIDYDEIIVEFP